MKSPRRANHDFTIDKLINFFYELPGNRAMPNLFSNVFDEELLKKHQNKSKQLAYLFEVYKEDDRIIDLLNILIENLSWTEELEKKLNELIEPLNLICQNGKVIKKSELEGEISFGVFINASKKINKNPEDKEEILAKLNIPLSEYDEFDNEIKSINKKMRPIFENFLPKLPRIPNIPILEISEILENLASYTFIPTSTISTPLVPRTKSFSSLTKDTDSTIFLFIFQFPAITGIRIF